MAEDKTVIINRDYPEKFGPTNLEVYLNNFLDFETEINLEEIFRGHPIQITETTIGEGGTTTFEPGSNKLKYTVNSNSQFWVNNDFDAITYKVENTQTGEEASGSILIYYSSADEAGFAANIIVNLPSGQVPELISVNIGDFNREDINILGTGSVDDNKFEFAATDELQRNLLNLKLNPDNWSDPGESTTFSYHFEEEEPDTDSENIRQGTITLQKPGYDFSAVDYEIRQEEIQGNIVVDLEEIYPDDTPELAGLKLPSKEKGSIELNGTGSFTYKPNMESDYWSENKYRSDIIRYAVKFEGGTVRLANIRIVKFNDCE